MNIWLYSLADRSSGQLTEGQGAIIRRTGRLMDSGSLASRPAPERRTFGLWNSVWSPDGQWVLFDRFRPQGGDIWMMENIE
ncbi:MAG TPA: hypothetical protein VLN44_13440 [Pyrinomonadaceae bacterium]|nr:hypothetical protein [Pyrinomonadaceae bacterium]